MYLKLGEIAWTLNTHFYLLEYGTQNVQIGQKWSHVMSWWNVYSINVNVTQKVNL